MIKFDTSGLEETIEMLKRTKQKLEKGKEKYYNFLINQVHIEGRLKSMIKQTVYNSSDKPEYYKWTYHLLEATRVEVRDGELFLYMDDEWLGKQREANEPLNYSVGNAPAQHKGEGYAKDVEYDSKYVNKNPNGYNTISIEGSHYMEKNFEQLVSEVKSGKISSKELLYPLFTEWGR